MDSASQFWIVQCRVLVFTEKKEKKLDLNIDCHKILHVDHHTISRYIPKNIISSLYLIILRIWCNVNS